MTRSAKKRHQKRALHLKIDDDISRQAFTELLEDKQAKPVMLDQAGEERVKDEFGISPELIGEAKAAGMHYYVPELNTFLRLEEE